MIIAARQVATLGAIAAVTLVAVTNLAHGTAGDDAVLGSKGLRSLLGIKSSGMAAPIITSQDFESRWRGGEPSAAPGQRTLSSLPVTAPTRSERDETAPAPAGRGSRGKSRPPRAYAAGPGDSPAHARGIEPGDAPAGATAQRPGDAPAIAVAQPNAGPARGVSAQTCGAQAWPHISAECLEPGDAPARRAVRTIALDQHASADTILIRTPRSDVAQH